MRIIIFILSLFSITQFKAQTKSALFLGNSYTYYNTLPVMINKLANTFDDTLVFDQNTPGGQQLVQHVVNATSLNKIAQGTWDYVIIQEQSQKPSFPPSQVATDVFPYAEILVDSILSANQCAEPVFFMTWGRANGDSQNCAGYPILCTYEGMQNRLTDSYTQMGYDNQATISPVGQVWKMVRDSLPSLNLYTADNSHPSVAGSYVAACTFYATLFNQSPVGSNFISSLSQADANVIQRITEAVVLDSTEYWRIGANLAHADFSSSNTFPDIQFTSDATNAEDHFWDFGNGSTSIEEDPLFSFAPGSYDVQLTVSNLCSVDSLTSTIIINPTNINDIQFDFKLAPNPVLNYLEIRSLHEIDLVRIYSIDGKFIKKSTSRIIDLKSLHEGVYHVIIEINGHQLSKKFIKK